MKNHDSDNRKDKKAKALAERKRAEFAMFSLANDSSGQYYNMYGYFQTTRG